MGSPVSLGDALAAIDKAIVIYNKIKDAPNKINEIGASMTSLKGYMSSLQELADEKAEYGLASKRPELVKDINTTADAIKTDSKSVYKLLHKWNTGRGPLGLEFHKWIANAAFTFTDMDKLEALTVVINKKLETIDRQINLLNSFGINHLIQEQHQKNKQQKQKQKQKKNNNDGENNNTDNNNAAANRKPSPSPSRPPKPEGKVYNIIFVDPSNQARSSVAEAYCKLLANWTKAKGKEGAWRVKYAHSAGLRVKAQGDCAELVGKCGINMKLGNEEPNPIAMEALFDNKMFSYPFKTQVQNKALQRRSRGITREIFSHNDYIIVFERSYLLKLEKIKRVFRETYGASAVPKDMGKIVLLGAYGQNLTQPDIYDKDNPQQDPGQRRQSWNKTVSLIKVATKGFLTKEIGWEKPS